MRISPVASAAVAAVTVAVAFAAAPASSTGTSSSDPVCPAREYAMGVRYQQSANAAAAQRQGWLLAQERLEDVLDDRKPGERLAVVSDLDETALDNTPLLARDLEACHDYTSWDTWSDWELEGEPTLTPGALEFFTYAHRKHVGIFYISDRFAENKDATLATLRELGLPQVRPDHVLLYGTSKEERRQVVAKDHEIVLLLGDSLPDFHDDFDGAGPQEQQELVDKYADHFGRDWIMFPNAAYGTWRKAALRAWDAPFVVP